MRHWKPYRPISAICFAASLIGCGSAPEPLPKPHAYLLAMQTQENLAKQAIQANQFGKASKLYGQAFDRYAAINNADGMWRSALNQLQMLLALNAVEPAGQQLQQLKTLAKLYPATAPVYRDQLALLSIQWLIAQRDWPAAQQAFNAMPTGLQQSTAAQLNQAIIEVGSSAPSAQATVNSLLQTSVSPLQRARLLRLQAQLSPAKAEGYLQQSLTLYGDAYYLPGTAACYQALANTVSAKDQQAWYRQRAAAILRFLNE